MKIFGTTVGTTMPRANLKQNDPKKADYVFGKEDYISDILKQAKKSGEFKSAYEYAKDAGYEGSEAEFAKKLAEDAYAVVYYEGAFDEEKVLSAVAEGRPVYCLYLAYFLPLVHWTDSYSFGGCYDNKIVTVKYAEGAWSVSEETLGEGGESNVVMVTPSTSQAEMNEVLHSDKVVVLKRGQAGGSYKLYYYAGNNSFFCVYHGVTEVAVYDNGTWTYSTVEGGAGNVFIGDENTTVAEYYEAYQNKKACFMYRPMGPSGYNMWTMYKANMYTAFFHNINDAGNVLYGTLKSDGTWDFKTKDSSTTSGVLSVNGVKPDASGNVEVSGGNGAGGVTSWNDLEDKPFGEFPSDTLTWDGNTDGMVSFVDEYEGGTFYKVSDADLASVDFEMSVTEHYAGGEIFTYGSESLIVPDYEPYFAIADMDGNDCVIFIQEAGVRGAPEVGLYFRKNDDGAYVQSFAIPGVDYFTATKKIDAKYLPDNGVASVTLSGDSCADTDAMDQEQIGVLCDYAQMFMGYADCLFVTPNYDALYEALKSGKPAMLCFDQSWIDDVGYRLPPKNFITAYALTRGGLLCFIAREELPFAFTNGSYHNADTDPFA